MTSSANPLVISS